LIGTAFGDHDAGFWKQIRASKFAVPPNESPGKLALELVELVGNSDPVLRDECGYEIFATWIYRDHRLNGQELESVCQKLLSGMTFHIGQTENDSVFKRSFSALDMSVLAAEDLQKPFFSEATFNQALVSALDCYEEEKDLRGYVPEKGWAHATAHVADLLKFLGRNPKLSTEGQTKIVNAIARRCRTAPSVFVWGEDARMAAALLSLVNRKDFKPSIFDDWFQMLMAENKRLWKDPTIDIAHYSSVRTQSNVLVQLSAKMAAQEDNNQTSVFRPMLNNVLGKIDHPDE